MAFQRTSRRALDSRASRALYEGKLGLGVVRTEGEEAITYASGGVQLLVYRSQFARTNQATAVN